jgi:hypothetical protein
LIFSSSLQKDNNLHGQDKILEICQILCADQYYNAIGGQELYSYSRFKECGIKLQFLKTGLIEYQQFGGIFQENLSIVDVMMFNSVDRIQEMLNKFDLV